MTLWAIADLHLAKGVPSKHMRIFGPQWEDYMEKIEAAWRCAVAPEDLVLIPGDISWAMNLEQAKIDLDWIGALPGTKLLLKGNHDYWWGSLAKVQKILPSSCHLLQNNSFQWDHGRIAIGGSRLWDIPGINFSAASDSIPPHIPEIKEPEALEESQKIYERELLRLEASLKCFPSTATIRIAMTHYPPIGPFLEETAASALLEKYGVQICLFGHLHHTTKKTALFGSLHGIAYHLVACDYLEAFKPFKIPLTE